MLLHSPSEEHPIVKACLFRENSGRLIFDDAKKVTSRRRKIQAANCIFDSPPDIGGAIAGSFAVVMFFDLTCTSRQAVCKEQTSRLQQCILAWDSSP